MISCQISFRRRRVVPPRVPILTKLRPAIKFILLNIIVLFSVDVKEAKAFPMKGMELVFLSSIDNIKNLIRALPYHTALKNEVSH